MAKPNVCCSIELEPKTLNQGQLHKAREVAADVVQKLEHSEATLVLIDMVERLRPMKCMFGGGGGGGGSLREFEEERKRCQCSYVSTDQSPNKVLELLKEPLSAPF
uniref:Uncharacterized protein n=1 Tax=Cucumis sativus TaxID=3659 RepID=A0A0A0K9S8_CUCSA